MAQRRVGLGEAAMTALQERPALRSAALTREAQSSAVTGAWSRLLPEVRVDAMYTHMNEPMVLDLDPIRGAMIALQSQNAVSFAGVESMLTQGRPLTDAERAAVRNSAAAALDGALPHFQEVLKEENFLQGAVTVRQPLFAGGRILAGIKAARAQSDLAEAKYDAQREGILAEVAERYHAAQLAGENVRVRTMALEAVRRHVLRAERLLAQGVIARHDKLRADVALEEAERALFESEEQQRIAGAALAASMGVDDVSVDALDTLGDLEDGSERAWVDGEWAVNVGMDRPEHPLDANTGLRQLRAAELALRQKSRARLGEYLPTVYGYGMYNLFDHYMIEKAEPKWAVGIGVSMTLFSGFRRGSEYHEARMEEEAMRLLASDVERNLRLLLRKEEMEMRLAGERYRKLATAEQLALENVRLVEKRYEQGLGTSIEVVDAQLQLNATRLQRAAAVREYHQHTLVILRMTGRIDEFFEEWERERGGSNGHFNIDGNKR